MAKRDDVIEIPVEIVYVDRPKEEQPVIVEELSEAEFLRKKVELAQMLREAQRAEDPEEAKPVLVGLIVLPAVPVRDGKLTREELAAAFAQSMSKIK